MADVNQRLYFGIDRESIKTAGEDLIKAIRKANGIFKTSLGLADTPENRQAWAATGKKAVTSFIDPIRTSLNLPAFSINLQNIANSFLTGLSNTLTNALAELKDMQESRYLTNESTWSNVAGRGMSIAESWAYNKVMGQMGLTEDSMYRMNEEQWNTFMDRFKRYTDRYNSIYDSGLFDDIQEYEWAMEDFKEEIVLNVAQWFRNNKDTVKNILEKLTQLLNWGLDLMTKLFGNSASANASSYIANAMAGAATSTHSTQYNINAGGNTYNNVDSNGQAWFERMMGELAETIVNESR